MLHDRRFFRFGRMKLLELCLAITWRIRSEIMFHNTLYRLERNQKVSLACLATLFLVLCVVWSITDAMKASFNMEPIVVFFGGISTLLAVWWPFSPGYRDKRLKGRIVADFTCNNGRFSIGNGELTFELKFSRAGVDSLHFYNDHVESVALIPGAGAFENVADCTSANFTSRVVNLAEGQIACVKNKLGHYALVQLLSVRDTKRGDDRNEFSFRYLINPKQATNFT